MGRQAYMNRLALGRSPYEAPERSSNEQSSTARQRSSTLHADGYVQQYDERGHPVNPESKLFGRELRRAKNDILSTMGIVVSGEDGNMGISDEQQKINLIAAENDYGLVMATLDQVFVFLGSWWTSSFARRVQTFKSYTHVPVMNIIRYERTSVGLMGFYFAGIPAWAVSSCLSICRHHPLERLIAFIQSRLLRHPTTDLYSLTVRFLTILLHSATRGALLALSVQTYMYSLLQSLHLIKPYSLPSIEFFIPFSSASLIQLPSIPNGLSVRSLSRFVLDLLKSPAILIYLYVCLRPLLEVRLYRLIRRRLPKPDFADELSIRVAFENDLIDWMVPTLGRRGEEENRRSQLTLVEDIKYELSTLKSWILSWFGFKPERPSDRGANSSSREERIESLRHCIEELQTELGAAEARNQLLPQQPVESQQMASEQAFHNAVAGPSPGQPGPTVSMQTPEPESLFNMDQVLSNEENRISQSPGEMSSDYLHDLAPAGQARPEPSRPDLPHRPLRTETNPGADGTAVNRRNSRSNTLFSRPSSPETSPPTSPRVRASLVHQNSDIITMQLELLSNRNPPNQNQPIPRRSNETEQPSGHAIPANHRAITEFLDALIENHHQVNSTLTSDVGDSDGLSSLTVGASPSPVDPPVIPVAQAESQPNIPAEDPVLGSPLEVPVSSVANIPPDSVEEPPQEDTENQAPDPDASLHDQPDAEARPLTSRSHTGQRSVTNHSVPAHRVTILSSHPVDSLASHLASIITGVALFPLESLYLRSLAVSYLSTTGSSAALRSDIRSLGAWAGGGTRKDVVAYMGKIALIMGVQAAVNAGVWGVITGTAIRLGRQFCGWGSF